MDPSQPNSSGFSGHVLQQLQQASQQVPAPNQKFRTADNVPFQRGQRSRGANRGRHFNQNSQHPRFSQLHQSQNPQQSSPVIQNQETSHRAVTDLSGYPQNLNPQSPQNLDMNSFPPLGSQSSPVPSRSVAEAAPQPQNQAMQANRSSAHGERAQDFFQRARGGAYRARGPFHQQAGPSQQRYAQQSRYHVQPLQADEFRRPQAHNTGVYIPMAASLANQRHALRKRFVQQCDFLEEVASNALQTQMPVTEQQEKEAFRQTLENIVQNVVREYGKATATLDPQKVKLKCYGSLASGFAVAGSDVDLLLSFPKDHASGGDIEIESPRLVEKALLDAGYGARLLTHTRVPILRVCETPSPTLLDKLRKYRSKWEQEEEKVADLTEQLDGLDPSRLPLVTKEQIIPVTRDSDELAVTPANIPLPPSPTREQPQLEYSDDCGIKCDVNFSNFVAIYNTRLLRTYCQLDDRVRRLGLIVKAWAKARKINTPYHGTLSSYGYILMVLHYCLNVANPPVVPNLQLMAIDEDSWAGKTDFERFEGFDVRFYSNLTKIAAATEGHPRNQESLGSLLRGFFWYYADKQGFYWTQQVISIRSPNGILTKQEKGWTEKKFSGEKRQITNRYLFCIEDPFETEHNVARVVGHNGIISIRDEFRRAWKIIERVQPDRSVGWQWITDRGEVGEDFMAVCEDRGDLLKQDRDFNRQKLQNLKAAAEAREKALKDQTTATNVEGMPTGQYSVQNGMSKRQENSHPGREKDGPFESDRSNPKLTYFIDKTQKISPRSRRTRRLKSESDGEQEDKDAKFNSGLGTRDNDISNTKKEGSTVATSSNLSEDQEDPETEPYGFYQEAFQVRGLDSSGKPVAWDLSTQDGRWLQWRDNKIRENTFTAPNRPEWKALNEQCPYDPARPTPAFSVFVRAEGIRPPWPMSKSERVTTASSEKAMGSDVCANAPVVHSLDTFNEDSKMKWDRSHMLGRWLIWRDNRIRKGTWNEKRSLQTSLRRRLNADFPYRANVNLEHQAETNARLKSFEKENLTQKGNQKTKDEESSVLSEERALAPLPEAQSLAEYRSLRPKSEVQPLASESQPHTDFVREQRLAYFASQSSDHAGADSQQPKSVLDLMNEAGLTSQNRVEMRKDPGLGLPGRCSQDSSIHRKNSPQHRRSKLDLASEPIPTATLGPDDSASAYRLGNTSTEPSESPHPRFTIFVPQSLYPPNSSPSIRPRDEDPDIMPIPSALGYSFDPRQLRDLDVIREGGNGCARMGEEWNVEIDGEWGGGGDMGYKSSTQEVAELGETWVAGRGDEEGLLEELPGL